MYKRKLITIGLVVAAILLIGSLAFLLQDRTRIVVIPAIPDDSTVKIDGKQVKNGEPQAVKPGKHAVQVQRQGFKTQTITVEAQKNKTSTVEPTLLLDGPVGLQWLQDNEAVVMEYEERVGKIYDDAAQKQVKAHPLITRLPETRRYWRIDYGTSVKNPDDPEAVAITITYGAEYPKQEALKWVRDQGFNPDDYEIIYRKAE